MAESHRLVVSEDALADWCRRWLGAPPVRELFESGYLATVKGLRLADGRDVVVKVRPAQPRLAGCAAVRRALWTAGFPCPEPLVDLEPLAEWAATAEALVPGASAPPPDGELIAASATALARLVSLAPAPGSVPELAPSPSWTGWDHSEPGLWPTLEDRDEDLNDYPEPRWLARVAAAVRERLGDHTGALVVGHGDWWPDNLHWRGGELVAAHDWDSAICQPEVAVAGLAAACFRGILSSHRLASTEDSAAFLEAYQRARGLRWNAEEYAACWAAGLWQRAIDTKTLSFDGDAGVILPRAEARDRLRRADLDPALAG